MEVLLSLIILAIGGYWAYSNGKRIGSRRAYQVGRRHGQRLRHKPRRIG